MPHPLKTTILKGIPDKDWTFKAKMLTLKAQFRTSKALSTLSLKFTWGMSQEVVMSKNTP